jgi:hypothetical protein
MWGGKYAERLNLLYMQGIKHICLVNYRLKLLLIECVRMFESHRGQAYFSSLPSVDIHSE